MAKMLDSCLVRQCAPTLAGVKVGSLFCLEIADGVLLCNILARWNKALNVKGVLLEFWLKRMAGITSMCIEIVNWKD